MYYIIGDGRILEFCESCPSQKDLKEMAYDCLLDELWVIEGEHSGITWERPEEKTKAQIVFGQPETYPSAQNSNMPRRK